MAYRDVKKYSLGTCIKKLSVIKTKARYANHIHYLNRKSCFGKETYRQVLDNHLFLGSWPPTHYFTWWNKQEQVVSAFCKIAVEWGLSMSFLFKAEHFIEVNSCYNVQVSTAWHTCFLVYSHPAMTGQWSSHCSIRCHLPLCLFWVPWRMVRGCVVLSTQLYSWHAENELRCTLLCSISNV